MSVQVIVLGLIISIGPLIAAPTTCEMLVATMEPDDSANRAMVFY
jgi:hypothetical protein